MGNFNFFTTPWSQLNSALLTGGILFVLFSGNILMIGAIGILSFLTFFLIHIRFLMQSSIIQHLANIVTGIRLILTLSLLILPFFFPLYTVGLLGLIILLGDTLDGYLARRFNSQTPFGSHFDMETDAYFILILCLLAFSNNLAGIWILLPGMMRYIYVFVYPFRKNTQNEEPRSYRGQVIAVMLMISLLACFILPKNVYVPLLYGAVFLTLYSFSLDIWMLFRPQEQKNPTPTPHNK